MARAVRTILDARKIRYLVIPLREAEILDDWHAMGMRGTGSFSLMLRDVCVPEHRTVTIADIIAGTPPGCHVHPDYAVLRAPRYFLVPFVLPAVGFALARRALELVPAALRGRGLSLSDARLLRLGEASALIKSGLLIFATRRAGSVALLSPACRFRKPRCCATAATLSWRTR